MDRYASFGILSLASLRASTSFINLWDGTVTRVYYIVDTRRGC